MKKWMLVILSPMMLTMLVYAVGDRSKFQGYSSAANAPLSNWGDGTFGVADFSNVLPNAPNQHWFFIIRLIFSITINVSSVLLVLIDAVCLEVRQLSSQVGMVPILKGRQWGFRESSGAMVVTLPRLHVSEPPNIACAGLLIV